MTIFCYATVHIFEAIISYIFFSNKFTPKLNNNAMSVILTASPTIKLKKMTPNTPRRLIFFCWV